MHDTSPTCRNNWSPSRAARVRESRDAGIVDQDRDIAATRGGRRDMVRIGDVELDRLDAVVARNVGDAARAGIDLAAAGAAQRVDERASQSAIGAGDES